MLWIWLQRGSREALSRAEEEENEEEAEQGFGLEEEKEKNKELTKKGYVETGQGAWSLVDSRWGYEVPFKADGAVTLVRFYHGNGERFCCLWDSGASFTYIDEKLLVQMDLKPQGLTRPRKLIMFDGSLSDAGPIKHFMDVSILIREDRKPKSIQFYVTQLADTELVIGRSWMRIHGVCLDMEEGRVKVKEVGQRKELVVESNGEHATLQGLVGDAWHTHEDLAELKDIEAQFWEPPENLDWLEED